MSNSFKQVGFYNPRNKEYKKVVRRKQNKVIRQQHIDIDDEHNILTSDPAVFRKQNSMPEFADPKDDIMLIDYGKPPIINNSGLKNTTEVEYRELHKNYAK